MEALPVFSVASASDERTKALAKCLHENHITFSALRDPQLLFHNHMPHILGSSYYLGASSTKLEQIAEAEGNELRPIETVPLREALTEDTWRSQWRNKEYTVSFVNFYDDKIKAEGGDWKKVVADLLYSTKSPLINGFCGGLGHPFIHLHYAYEYDSAEVASEALALGSTEYDFVHQYFDSAPPDTSTYKTRDLEEIVDKVRLDKRFDGLASHPGFLNTFALHATREAAVLEHYNAWEYDGSPKEFESLFDTAVRLAIETTGPAEQFDFFLIHVLTVAHALRAILPNAPQEFRVPIVKQFAMWTIVIYCAQLRRKVNHGAIASTDIKGRDWTRVVEQTLTNEWSLDSHYVKVVRALKVGEELYGEKDGWYLKAALDFVDRFNGWTGFGPGVSKIEGAPPSAPGWKTQGPH